MIGDHVHLLRAPTAQDQQAVTFLPRLVDQVDQGSIGGIFHACLGDPRVGARHVLHGLDERAPVVEGRVERQRDHGPDEHRGGEAQQDQEDPPGHGTLLWSASRKPCP